MEVKVQNLEEVISLIKLTEIQMKVIKKITTKSIYLMVEQPTLNGDSFLQLMSLQMLSTKFNKEKIQMTNMMNKSPTKMKSMDLLKTVALTVVHRKIT